MAVRNLPSVSDTDTSRAALGAAWSRYCQGLEALGAQLLSDRFPTDSPQGFVHLAEQAICWLDWELLHADPRRPAFQRQNDPIRQWGGPNADNVYRHARIEPSRRYRIWGRMNSCDDFILALRAGFMHQEKWGTLATLTASELGIGRGGDFEILLGGPDGTPIPDGVLSASIREYYVRWTDEAPAEFSIECLDDDALDPAPAPTVESVETAVTRALAQTSDSLSYWNTFMLDQRAQLKDNSFAPALQVAKGLKAANYAYCFWNLQPDEALVIDSDVPPARYWSLQLYSLGWFELVGWDERLNSLNNDQTVRSDGRLRVVVSAQDPGTANWLDIGDRPEGLLMFRWFWADGTPTPTASVVPFDEVRSDEVDPAARREVMRHRREHLTRRFRT
jgi:Protein of unknown function (DUF1214)